MRKLIFITMLFILAFCETFANKEVIKTVKIGNQVWMAKNLEISTYRNGDLIRYASTTQELEDASNLREGAWCYYNFDPKNGEIYGKLYNWYAVNDARGLSPKGFHVPTDAEWTALEIYLGGVKAGKKMRSKTGWIGNGNGNNFSGFNGLPGGWCYGDGNCYDIGLYGYWWSSTERGFYDAWERFLWSTISELRIGRNGYSKDKCFSVRCIKD